MREVKEREFAECANCLDDCGACDLIGEVFPIEERNGLLMEKRLAEQAIKRHQRRIAEIDKALAEIEKPT